MPQARPSAAVSCGLSTPVSRGQGVGGGLLALFRSIPAVPLLGRGTHRNLCENLARNLNGALVVLRARVRPRVMKK